MAILPPCSMPPRPELPGLLLLAPSPGPTPVPGGVRRAPWGCCCFGGGCCGGWGRGWAGGAGAGAGIRSGCCFCGGAGTGTWPLLPPLPPPCCCCCCCWDEEPGARGGPPALPVSSLGPPAPPCCVWLEGGGEGPVVAPEPRLSLPADTLPGPPLDALCCGRAELVAAGFAPEFEGAAAVEVEVGLDGWAPGGFGGGAGFLPGGASATGAGFTPCCCCCW
mmetsp:Transcript_16059/g.43755  ORF Transcript_16059/g.43755 Transcript_16059/m.43755 type:complete len:220 (+) Transcript_16059:562-1221(+)